MDFTNAANLLRNASSSGDLMQKIALAVSNNVDIGTITKGIAAAHKAGVISSDQVVEFGRYALKLKGMVDKSAGKEPSLMEKGLNLAAGSTGSSSGTGGLGSLTSAFGGQSGSSAGVAGGTGASMGSGIGHGTPSSSSGLMDTGSSLQGSQSGSQGSSGSNFGGIFSNLMSKHQDKR